MTSSVRRHPLTSWVTFFILLRILTPINCPVAAPAICPISSPSRFLLTFYRTKPDHRLILRFTIALWSHLCLTEKSAPILKGYKIRMSGGVGMHVGSVVHKHRNHCLMDRRAFDQEESEHLSCGSIIYTKHLAHLVLLIFIAIVVIRPLVGFAAETEPAVEEWLNQNVRLHDTVQVLDRPSSDGKPSGEIRAGAEVKAIGLVGHKQWVQIELPDHSLAYVPRAAIEFENDAVPPSAPAAERSATPTGAATGAPPTTVLPATAPAATPGTIRGPVTRVPNAATLVVADQRLRLSGIDPGPQEALGPFENWVRGQGVLMCEPDAQTRRYHCFTGGGVDVAEAAILNGAGRVGDGATPAYRESETQARQGRRGLWAQP
jgi:endonuclease YncB( thermonuclease family)